MTQVNPLSPRQTPLKRSGLVKLKTFGAFNATPVNHSSVDGKLADFIALVSQNGPFEPRLVIQYAQQALLEDSEFDSKLVESIHRGEHVTGETAIRVLRGLECFCSKPRLLEHLLRLKSLDGRVRSKVTLTVGRLVQNPDWLREQLKDGNARVRANAVEALWGVNVPGVDRLLCDAIDDSNNRVIANAAVGLHKIGNIQCIAAINGLLRHKSELFRRSGLYAIVQTRDARYLKAVRRHLKAKSAEERNWAELAIRTIDENQRRTGFLSQIDIEVRHVRTEANGLRRVALSCLSQNLTRWIDPMEMTALDFVITDAGRQVEQYELHALPSGASLSTVVLFPAACLPSVQIFREILPTGSDAENIAFVPYYSSDSSVAPRGPEDEPTVIFDNKVDDLIAPLERGEARIAQDVGQALMRSAQALKLMQGWKHIVIFVDPSTRIDIAPSTIAALHDQNIQVHGVVAADAPASSVETVENIAHTFGGAITRCKSADDLRHLLFSIRVGQFGLFELSWTTPKPGPSSITIQCCSRFGVGAANLYAADQP